MRSEPHSLRAFYASRQGAVAAGLIQARLRAIWPDVAGCAVLGVGYGMPFLRPWRDQARRCVAITPAQLGLARWPAGRPGLSCVSEEDALPFPDLCFDRVLLVHGLEVAENPRLLLRDIWRVLKDDGRLLVVAANRRGLWAHVEATPFGQGRPFSAGQLSRLLTDCLFRPERRDVALFMPPLSARPVLRGAPMIERVGRRLLPSLAGVALSEASKDLLASIPAHAVLARWRARSRRVLVADGA